MALNDYYTLGSSGLRVSSLALGTMTFDDGSRGSRPADSFTILDCYLGLGGNFIDTANFLGRLVEAPAGARRRPPTSRSGDFP